MTDEQRKLATELAKRDGANIREVADHLKGEALQRYHIALLRRNNQWNDVKSLAGG